MHHHAQTPATPRRRPLRRTLLVIGSALVLSSLTLTGVTQAATPGPHRLLVVRASMDGAPSIFTREQVADAIFGAGDSVASFYADQSAGKITLGGDIVDGPQLSAAAPGESCDGFRARATSTVDVAVAAAGIDAASYDNVVLMAPSFAPCSWSGLGQQPGRRIWIDEQSVFSPLILPEVLAHELGHNLGASHAGAGCAADPGLDCEYADPFDAMGNEVLGSLSAPHRFETGLLGPGEITVVHAGGGHLCESSLRRRGSQLEAVRWHVAVGTGAPISTEASEGTVVEVRLAATDRRVARVPTASANR